MDYVTELGILGSIASLIGAWISIHQVKEARKAKDESIKIKEFLTKKYEDYHNIQFRPEIKVFIDKLNDAKSRNPEVEELGKEKNPEINETTKFLNHLMSEKIYQNKEVKTSVDISLELLKDIDNSNYKNYLGLVCSHLATISRFIDIKARD